MSPEILVINAGSSSIKVSLFEATTDGPRLEIYGQIEGLGTPQQRGMARNAKGEVIVDENWPSGNGPKDHGAAMALVVDRLTRGRPDWRPAGVGHRVVHGGTRYAGPVQIDEGCRSFLDALVGLAPLHIPGNLKGIDAAAQAFPGVPQVACFDTSFHRGREFVSEAFALPRELFHEGVRRFGFHGLSYEYIVRRMRAIAPDVARGRMIVAHLGNGASMCAIRDGRSVETTMAFTAVDGLPMGTRCGQLDPGVVLYLMIRKKMNPMEVLELLHKRSGLLGLSGVSSDMRELLASKEPYASEAIDYFVYRATGFVGALAAALGGVDGLVFTAGIGEHAAPIRERICRNLEWLGVELDPSANSKHETRITTPNSRVSVWVVPTNEELMIAQHVVDLLKIR